ncbi:hypothetical protein D3C81_1991870 [compost metagenome]
MASGKPIRVNGMVVRITLWSNRVPWHQVTSVAIRVLTISVMRMRGRTEPRTTRNNRSAEGRSRTIMLCSPFGSGLAGKRGPGDG